MTGTQGAILYLLPAPLVPYDPERWTPAGIAAELPSRAIELLTRLDRFVVESERSALRLISRYKDSEAMARAELRVLDEHSSDRDVASICEEFLPKGDCGLLTEAGLPCIADPGAALVSSAREAGFRIVPISGPSSIMLALIASGLDGQSFHFCGYLPRGKEELEQKLSSLAREFSRDRATRIFIEAPYRNDSLLSACLDTLPADMRLCAATALDSPDESIRSMRVDEWRRSGIRSIGKSPTVFLFGEQACLSPSTAGKGRDSSQSRRTKR